MDALEREQRGEPAHDDCYIFFRDDEPFATCAELMREQGRVDRRLIAYCTNLRDSDCDTSVSIARPGKSQHDSRARLLAHLFQHQIHHRGQVHTMLAGTHVKPPQLDEFFCQGDAEVRADELLLLGIAEQDIWGESLPREG